LNYFNKKYPIFWPVLRLSTNFFELSKGFLGKSCKVIFELQFWHFFGSKKEKTSLGFMQNFGTFKSFKNQRKKKDKEYMQLYDCTSYQIKPSFKGEKKITMKTIFTQSIKKSNIFTTFCSLSVQ